MRRFFLRGVILLPVFVLQGCALPVPVQVASWVIDGISFLISEKSIADHGVSFVVQKDCAVWRGIKGESFCREDIEGVYALWDTDGDETSVDLAEDIAPAPRGAEDEPEDLEAFTTAAGPRPVAALPAAEVPEAAPSGSPEASHPEPVRTVAAIPETPVAFEPLTPVASAPVFNLSRFFETLVSPAEPFGTEKSALDDMYYVIGSFNGIMEAERLANRYFNLEPAVIVAVQNGRQDFRVVVGPYTPADEVLLRRAISRTGLSNIWAMRFDPIEWELSPLPSRDVAELP